MASDIYELLALLMRYVFVLIGLMILLRAYRWMRRDAKNYRREMRALPDAGLVGEIVDLRTGKSQPLPREGDMGASRECDIHVRGGGVLRHHVRFAFEEGRGVLITPSRRGKTFMGGAQLRAPAYALHGTQLQLGDALLRVRLFAGLKVPHPAAFQPEDSETPFGGTDAPYAADAGDSFLDLPGPATPAPFEFPQQAEGDPRPAYDDAFPADGTAAPYAPAAPAQADYEGNYTEDGQMTWKYAYSLEDLRQAQSALGSAQEDEEENDEALPYRSPMTRHRRRDRK